MKNLIKNYVKKEIMNFQLASDLHLDVPFQSCFLACSQQYRKWISIEQQSQCMIELRKVNEVKFPRICKMHCCTKHWNALFQKIDLKTCWNQNDNQIVIFWGLLYKDKISIVGVKFSNSSSNFRRCPRVSLNKRCV